MRDVRLHLRSAASAVGLFFKVAAVWFGAGILAIFVIGGHAAITVAGPALVTAIAGTFGSHLALSFPSIGARRFWQRAAFASVVAVAPVALFFVLLAGLGETLAAVSLITPFAVAAFLVSVIVEWLFGHRPGTADSAT